MNASDLELIRKFRARTAGWGLNDDKAWVKVKLGEMRAVLAALDAYDVKPAEQGEKK